MDLTSYVNNLGREFATLAGAGGEEARALAERLSGALESAIRLTLLETLTAATDEITREMAPGSVEVRLRGRDPDFVVTAAPAEPDGATVAPTGTTPDTVEDGPAARINVRMPEQLKAAIEEAAAREGRSVNAWLVRAAAAALQPTDRVPPREASGAKRAKQGFTGWVR
ncbi:MULTISPECIES: ribbon-helix-helix protein, CopG family [Actinoplanes]|uniref:ribbon-helix-helix protein, CopG family n=1 Tax=Actinoplanes TaxID=1865 RepID=UPI0005F28BF8|nr:MULTISPECIES: ribbon-helix-helix protein, CopG family [Actinoplanes]GLY04496.1 hypothetical protein Acsp01_48750 [Actinoplanes sp. NBRC 101535]